MINELIDEIVRREGGFVDHPADRGGPTKYGITQSTLADYRGRAVSRADVQALTEEEARGIYRERYVAPFEPLASGPLLHLLVDSAVQHGVTRVTRWLQQAVGVPDDGVVGPVTKGAVRDVDDRLIYRQLLAQRLRFYGRLITDDRSQAAFAAGWMNRVSVLVEATP